MKTYRILLTTVGGGNGINVCRSLRRGLMSFSRRVFIVGTNINKYELAKSNADKNYIVPRFNDPAYCDAIAKIIEKEKIDFVIPNHEFEISAIRKYNDERILDKCFLPSRETVELCINKYDLISYLNDNGLEKNVPYSFQFNVFSEIDVDKYEFPLWIRLVRGAGSRGATLIRDKDELKFWLDYWMKYQNVDLSDFMASEYLPGKDHHYFSLWKNGDMVLGKAIERLEYCCAKYTLTGTSSSPSLCKMVADTELDYLSQKIIKTVDPHADGLFGIDYKANKDGIPCLTEINVGRFPRINYIFNHVGPNMAEHYFYCGMGINFERPPRTMDEGDEWYLFRDFDLGLVLKHKDEIEKFFDYEDL
jgi:carbamoyl-phosphate synthase large subunit